VARIVSTPLSGSPPSADSESDRSSAGACRSAAQSRQHCGQDPGRVDLGAADRAIRCDSRLRGERISAGRVVDDGGADRGAGRAGGAGFGRHRTLRSTAANPASDSSSAPECLQNSATIQAATATSKHERTTPAFHRSPKPPAQNGSSWRASPATAASATHRCCGVRRVKPLTRRPRLLRPTARPRSHPLPSPPSQPVSRIFRGCPRCQIVHSVQSISGMSSRASR
jgi:hypothetical protein